MLDGVGVALVVELAEYLRYDSSCVEYCAPSSKSARINAGFLTFSICKTSREIVDSTMEFSHVFAPSGLRRS